jgi:hypothetical protein
VNDRLDREEVLDGQQRLRAIYEFVKNLFPIDGKLKPYDYAIQSLDGMYFRDLPTEFRARINRFTLITVRLRDYKPEEPGELFFRLNQLTALTAAEQRNALFGEARDQIRSLSEYLEEVVTDPRAIGFSNARMNYDDVLSRLAISLEAGNLAEKISASRLEDRYRTGEAFPPFVYEHIKHSLFTFGTSVRHVHAKLKFNKATLFSWLYYICDNEWTSGRGHRALPTFIESFELARYRSPSEALDGSDANYAFHLRRAAYFLIQIFNDRSTARVNDVSSVLLRDLCLNAAAAWYGPADINSHPGLLLKKAHLDELRTVLSNSPTEMIESTMEEFLSVSRWGQR